jgi:ABC-type Mn2+/Zn2+ transport system permease subunit
VTVHTWLTEPWAYTFFPRALVACVLVMTLGALAGVGVRSQRQVYLGHGISQAMLAGSAAAALAGISGLVASFAASFTAALVAAAAVGWLRRHPHTDSDTAIAIVASTMLAAGIGALSLLRDRVVNTTTLLFGNVLGVTWAQIALGAGVAALAGTFFLTQARRLALLGLSPEVAAAHGVRVTRLGVTQLIMVALSVATFVHVAGALLAIVALVVPTAVAHCWSRTVAGLHLVGSSVGAATAVVGLYLSYWTNIASGPALTLSAAAIYAASLVATRYR